MRLTSSVNTVQSVSPQMIASIGVLQCGAQELSEYLENLSYENPMMDLNEPERKTAPPVSASIAEKFRWLRDSDRQNRSYYTDTDRDSMDQYVHREQAERLTDFVKEQILTLDISPEMRSAMETVAELLDGRGLFTGTVSEIARLSGCTEETARHALECVRELEPAGVAAESVQAALLKQIESMEKPVAKRILAEHFQRLGTWSDHRLARAMGVSEQAVTAAKTFIASLNPYPSGGFASTEEPQYVTPDLRIFEKDGHMAAATEDDYLPTVHINGDYLRMLETETDPTVQTYLREKLRQVEQVMENLDRRKSTLLRCGEVIARQQEPFFRGGSLRKLTLRDVAEELELHESTISRAVKNKYVQCDRGVFPMSALFSRDVGQNVGLSRSGIQEILVRIIDREDPRNPLSDEKIVGELEKQHITLSRRAVAKYRMELGIPAASGRKHAVSGKPAAAKPRESFEEESV